MVSLDLNSFNWSVAAGTTNTSTNVATGAAFPEEATTAGSLLVLAVSTEGETIDIDPLVSMALPVTSGYSKQWVYAGQMIGDPVLVPGSLGHPDYYWQNSVSIFYILDAPSMAYPDNITTVDATFQQIESNPEYQCSVTALLLEFLDVPSTDVVTALSVDKGYSDPTGGTSISLPTATDVLLIVGSSAGAGTQNAGASYYAFYDAPGVPMVIGGLCDDPWDWVAQFGTNISAGTYSTSFVNNGVGTVPCPWASVAVAFSQAPLGPIPEPPSPPIPPPSPEPGGPTPVGYPGGTPPPGQSAAVTTPYEIVSYSACAVSGQEQYSMSDYIRRGRMGTTIAAHPAGALFMRLDDTIFKYTYDPTWAGKTLYFKFLSFNTFQNNLQGLEDVDAIEFIVSGNNPGTVDASSGLTFDAGPQLPPRPTANAVMHRLDDGSGVLGWLPVA